MGKRIPHNARDQIQQKDIGYSELEAIIHEWVIGDDAERDREIMKYWLLDGLTHDAIALRYMLNHPDMPISRDTVRRIIRKRENRILAHCPG